MHPRHSVEPYTVSIDRSQRAVKTHARLLNEALLDIGLKLKFYNFDNVHQIFPTIFYYTNERKIARNIICLL